MDNFLESKAFIALWVLHIIAVETLNIFVLGDQLIQGFPMLLLMLGATAALSYGILAVFRKWKNGEKDDK